MVPNFIPIRGKTGWPYLQTKFIRSVIKQFTTLIWCIYSVHLQSPTISVGYHTEVVYIAITTYWECDLNTQFSVVHKEELNLS